jgi:hypothetical protein
VFNLNGNARHVEITFAELGVPADSGVKLALTDVITGETFAPKRDDFFVPVEGHGCKVYRVRFVRDRKKY